MKATRPGSSALAAAAMALAVAVWPTNAFAHGARDYTVVEYHYFWIGPFRQALPGVQHIYYCDGDYEEIVVSPGSQGYAFSVTSSYGEC